MITLLAIAIPLAVGTLVMFATIFPMRWYRSRDRRRSPLTTEMLRQPAQYLRTKVDAMNDDVSIYIALALMCPFMVSTLFFANAWYTQVSLADSRWLLYSIYGVLGTVIVTALAVRTGTARRKLLQAVDAELVVAQELEVLRPLGCRIFHDLQCGEFNIDHVVVGPGGVFAVETKSRLKPQMGSGADAVKVRYDGSALHFPGWTETKPLEQTARQAKWLAEKLSKATGEKVAVRGVLALPGWFVDRQARGDVSVTNPKKPEWMAKPIDGVSLEATQVQRIAYQLEQISVVAPLSKTAGG